MDNLEYDPAIPPYDSEADELDDSDDDYLPDNDTRNCPNLDEDENGSSERDEDDLTNAPQNLKNRKCKYSWTLVKDNEGPTLPTLPTFLPHTPEDSSEIGRPIHYFKLLFSNDLLDHIVYQSNLYSVQVNKPLNLTGNELEIFIGTLIYMSIYGLPRHRMFWACGTRINQVADVMSRKRWEAIKMGIHFNDNHNMPPRDDPNRDKLFKIRPPIDKLLTGFQNQEKDQMLCVDEQIVPFRGHSSLKQYNPNKPNKWGYKIFVLSDVKGLVHNFEVYTGKIEPALGKQDIGASGNIVLRLAEVIPRDHNYLLYYDNWFSSVDLMITLSEDGIGSVGTVRKNRLPGLKFTDDKKMKKEGRGTFEEYKTTINGVDMRVVKWYDNKPVILASSFCSAQSCDRVKRFDRKQKAKVDIVRPHMVKMYNSFMGGVDLLDGLISYHRILRRSKKWYLRLFFHFIDMSLVNSWVRYRKDMIEQGLSKKDILDLLAFRVEVAEALCLMQKSITKKRGRPSSSTFVDRQFEEKKKRGPTKPIPQYDVRTDEVGHWVLQKDQRQRCKFPSCGLKTFFFCSKCKVYLCITKKRNCFAVFHNASS